MFLKTSEDFKHIDDRSVVHSYIVSFSFSICGNQIMGSDEIHLTRPLRAFDHDLLRKYVFENSVSVAPPDHKDIVIMSLSPLGVIPCGVIKANFDRQER